MLGLLCAVLLPALQISDMARLVDLEEPAISPNGRRVALIAITQDARRARYVNTLFLIETASGAQRVLVRGSDVAVPRWSPDGTRLAYLARSSRDGIRQLYVRSPNGTARRMTSSRGDVIDAAWSPNGSAIAYVATDSPQSSGYFFAGDNDYTATAPTPPDHLWIVSASGGTPRRITRGSWTIAPTDPGGIFSPQIAWARDGRSITFTRVASTFSGDSEYSTLWQTDVRSGRLSKLTAHTAFELSPAYSPNGATLTYWYPRDGDFNAENTLRASRAGSDLAVAPQLDRNIAGALWFPAGRGMLLCAADRTQNVAWVLENDATIRTLPLGDLHMVCDPYSSSTFDSGIAADIARDGAIAFIGTSDRTARELYFLPAGATTPRRLTRFNDFLAHVALGTMSELDWTSSDGYHEDGVVTHPPHGSGKFPIVLLIHGGPGLASTRDFVWEQWPLAQMIASHGYVVLQPNYRGSDNLGNAYMTAIVRNTVVGPSSDIMAGLAALKTSPNVDPTRVAVSGWSYGGELTSWMIGHYHDWRAAVSGAAVNSELDEYNLSTSNVQDRYPLGTTPYTDDGQRVYRDNSPITYYAHISTPTFIWSTTQDPVVPITQSYALFHALTENHVPVRFAVFPASTHGPADPRQTAELTRLWLAWLDRYLR